MCVCVCVYSVGVCLELACHHPAVHMAAFCYKRNRSHTTTPPQGQHHKQTNTRTNPPHPTLNNA